jgi:hypothetical protein
MGRAQGKVSDQFTAAIGTRRGLRADQENMSSAPLDNDGPALSKDEVATRQRLDVIVQWLLRHASYEYVASHIAEQSKAYTDLRWNMVGTFTSDLERLVCEGVCFEAADSGSATRYGAHFYKSWPAETRQKYAVFIEDFIEEQKRIDLLS